MNKEYFADTHFEKRNYKEKPLPPADYENCRFSDCIFSEIDLSGLVFIDCTFFQCDLSLAKLTGTSLSDCAFTGCKMRGLHFDECNQLGLSFKFDMCNLDHSSFYKTKPGITHFIKCQLKDVDFSECNLNGSLFEECDLAGATFSGTTLEKADFSTSFNFIIDPEMNTIKKAVFSINGLPGLLSKYNIHIQNHCRLKER